MKELVMKSCKVFFDETGSPRFVRVSSDDYQGILQVKE